MIRQPTPLCRPRPSRPPAAPPSTAAPARHRHRASSTTAAPSTSPPSTAVTNERSKATVEQLVDSYDAVVAEILADPSVASDPGNELVRRYLAPFPQDSTFANGASASGMSQAAAGRSTIRTPRRDVRLDRSVGRTSRRGRGGGEGVHRHLIQIVDSAGALRKSQGRRTAARSSSYGSATTGHFVT